MFGRCERRDFRAAAGAGIGIWLSALLLLAPVPAAAGQRKAKSKAAPRGTSEAKKLLSQGTFYQSSNDTTDIAADLYRQVIDKYPTSSEAEAAHFYLGSYFQKKFYMTRERKGREDWAALDEAERAFGDYVGRYDGPGAHGLLADAFHSLAMIRFHRGDPGGAREYLDRMRRAAARDGSVYIYRVVWSDRSGTVVDKNCVTKALADGTQTLMDRYRNFDELVAALREWSKRSCK